MTVRDAALPALSVVVPTHNRRDSVIRLLDALKAQASEEGGVDPDRFEVVVVADGCEDDTAGAVRQANSGKRWPFSLALLEQSPGRGAATARNLGAARARGATLVFVDDDIEPFTGMLATHDAMHREASGRGDLLLLVGAPAPVRPPDASLHQVAAWGWWEQQFETMAFPGHRFTFDEIFTGVLSMPAALFHAVGGFDATLGDCHEDSELGLRLFRAGARTAFSREGGGTHHEVRDMRRLLPRKWAEGRADVRILRQWPELAGELRAAVPEPAPLSWMGLLRGLAMRWPEPDGAFRRLTTGLALRVLSLLDRWRWRTTWRALHGGLLVHSYWQGVAGEVGSARALADLIAECLEGRSRWRESARHLSIDLAEGLEAAERRLDEQRPDGLTVYLGEHFVGEVEPLPTAERLHGGHLRRILATTLAHGLRVARALQEAGATAGPARIPPVGGDRAVPSTSGPQRSPPGDGA